MNGWARQCTHEMERERQQCLLLFILHLIFIFCLEYHGGTFWERNGGKERRHSRRLLIPPPFLFLFLSTLLGLEHIYLPYLLIHTWRTGIQSVCVFFP
ncbi:hypothetical protein V8F33_004320 [Rhypophila sp. PSN 637]